MENKTFVINVCGAAEGIGKTTITKELSACLTKMNKKVLTVDFDLCFGRLRDYLHLSDESNMAMWSKDIINEKCRLDDSSFIESKYMIKHPSGFSVLLSKGKDSVLEISDNEINIIFNRILNMGYDFIIIDKGLNDGFNLPSNIVDANVLVTTKEMSVSFDTFDMLNKIILSEFPLNRIFLVLNKMSKESTNSLLGNLNTIIPEYNNIKEYNNNGSCAINEVSNDFTSSIEELSNKIIKSI